MIAGGPFTVRLFSVALLLLCCRNTPVAQAAPDFNATVETAVDAGCEWLKAQQGIEQGEDPAVFGQFPTAPPKYGEAAPHRYRFARTAFPVQALCKAGVFADDPAIVKAMEYLRKHYVDKGVLENAPGFVPSSTYEDATVLNAVEAFYISQREAKDRGLASPAKRFREDKSPIKRWGTEEKGAQKAKEDRAKKKPSFNLSAADKRMCELAVKAIFKRFRKAYGGAGWRYDPPEVGHRNPDIDCSATQYALLGLHCATRLGISYDRSILFEVYKFYETQQDKDGPVVNESWKDQPKEAGEPAKNPDRETRSYWPRTKDRARGWAYCRNDASAADAATYGAMTAAGIGALIMIRDELENDGRHKAKWKALAEPCEVMISDGMAWLLLNWNMRENPRRGMHRYYYYLYMIERIGMLGGIDMIGRHDWYRQGADRILSQQNQQTGMWDVQYEIDPSDIYNTCYALLFLKRETQPIDRPKPVFTGPEE